MHVFFQPDLSQTEIQLSEEESKHCIRVLRMKIGDTVHLADGKGTEALASIIDDNAKRCRLSVVSRVLHSSFFPYTLHLIVAPTKNFDRMEWLIEKATEVGVSSITFMETENSERNKVNMERCEKIAISAMKQSKQWHLPVIHNLKSFPDCLNHVPATSNKLIAWCEHPETELLGGKLLSMPNNDFTIMIGPEGDFTATEINQALAQGFVPVSLGRSILRTETAALYACMSVKTLITQ
jgi:16S rRNA (uracil1498-N3)-methyltransferase